MSINDLYSEVMLRRWSLDLETGRLECLHDAVDVTTVSAAVRAAIEERNADLDAAISLVEALEQGQPSDDHEVPSEVLALARLRAGVAAEDDVELLVQRWGGEIDVGTVTEPVPDRVSSRQFFLQLEADGLLELVEGWIEEQPLPIQIAFERSGTFVRSDEMLQLGFTAMGFSTDRVNEFFAAASLR